MYRLVHHMYHSVIGTILQTFVIAPTMYFFNYIMTVFIILPSSFLVLILGYSKIEQNANEVISRGLQLDTETKTKRALRIFVLLGNPFGYKPSILFIFRDIFCFEHVSYGVSVFISLHHQFISIACNFDLCPCDYDLPDLWGIQNVYFLRAEILPTSKFCSEQ